MGSEQLLKTRGQFVRRDQISWSDFPDQNNPAELTEEERLNVLSAFPNSKIALNVATQIKRLKAFNTSHREIAHINQGVDGFSLRNINKVCKCLTAPPPVEKNSPSPNLNKSGANAPLSIDF